MNQPLARKLRLLLGACISLLAIVFLTGCEAMRDYSIRSHNGPLPINDHVYVSTPH